jgi:ABC-2 type transport system permease protein
VPVVVGLVVALVAAATLEVSLTAAAYEVAGLSLPGWPVVYAAFAAITLLYALAYVALVVGISASTSSTSRAAALAVGAWVTLEVLWDVVPLGAVYVVDGFRLPANPAVLPDWATLLGLLSPGRAYLQATSGLTTETAQSGPAVLDPWVSVVVLAAWVVVPVALGYLRYRRADL